MQNDVHMLETYVEDLRYKHSQIAISPHTDPRKRIQDQLQSIVLVQSCVQRSKTSCPLSNRCRRRRVNKCWVNKSAQFVLEKKHFIELNADTERLVRVDPSLETSNSAVLRIRRTQVVNAQS